VDFAGMFSSFVVVVACGRLMSPLPDASVARPRAI